ncbi:hypothetical protein SNE40_002945 [Patella caerulea]|uniref:Uncharacterized protein n=1 Tax=Patella caerulea TaxID=87958 RepID=A0AAN8Q815_PATCE
MEIAEVQASLADISNKLSSQNNREHAVTREIGNGIPVDAELENSDRSTSLHLPAALSSSHSSVPSGMGLSNHRVPVDSLPPVKVVPQHIRKAIHSHKHENLAMLLIPGIETEGETRVIDHDGNQIVVKANDPECREICPSMNFGWHFPDFRMLFVRRS